MMMIVGIFACALSHPVHAVPVQPDESSWMVRGLIALKTKDRVAGFRLMEEGFEQAKDISEKTRFALLLAQATQPLKHKRHHYAAFALANGKQLSSQERSKLMTVVGDGYFEAGQVPAARSSYEEALTLSDVPARDREYLVYKLGWTYLNQKAPAQAYRLWLAWLKQSPSDEGLREDLLKAMARAWVEAQLAGGPTIDWDYSATPRTNELEPLTTGVRQGIQRGTISQGLRVLSTLNAHSASLANGVRAEWIDKLNFDPKKPCDSAPLLIEASNAFGLNAPSEGVRSRMVSQLMHCVRNIKPSAAETAQASHALAAIERLHPAGVEWWSLSEIYSKFKHPSKACGAAQQAVQFKMLSDSPSSDLDQVCLSMLDYCPASASTEWSEVGTQFGANPSMRNLLAAEFKKPTSPIFSAFARFLSYDPFRRSWWTSWKQSQPALQEADHPLTRWLVGWFSKHHPQELVSESGALLAGLSLEQKIPVVSTLVRFFVDQHQADVATQVLREWLPWDQTAPAPLAPLVTKIWLLHNDAMVPSARLPATEIAALLKLHADHLAAAAPVSAASIQSKDRSYLAHAFLNEHRVDEAWQHWPLISDLVSNDSVLGTSYFVPSLELALKKSPLLVHQAQIARDGYALFILDTAQRVESTDSSMLTSVSIPASLKGTPMENDRGIWSRIEALHARFFALSFSYSGILEKQVASEMKTLSTLRQSLLKHRWSGALMAEAAARRYVRARDALASAVESIPVPADRADASEQLKQVGSVIRTWEIGT